MPLAKTDLAKAARVAQKNPASKVKLAIQVFHDIIPELALLAKDKLSHGDIKPMNILSSQDHHYGLADFDDLVPFGSKHSYVSKSFSAPESIEMTEGQTQLLPAHPTSDLYSFALSLTEVLFPKPTREKGNSAITDRIPQNENTLREELRQDDPNLVSHYDSLIRFIKTCLSQDPRQRVINLQRLLMQKNYFAFYAESLLGILTDAMKETGSSQSESTPSGSPKRPLPQRNQCLQLLGIP